MLIMLATALVTNLVPVSLPASASANAENPHHDFRLTTELPATKVCPTSQGVTVCANRANNNLQFRVPAADLRASDAAGPHLRSLRIQPTRCVNPVEEGLRCIRPVPATRITLGN